MDPNYNVSYSHKMVPRSHSCNCMGCCERCGMCRTYPGHTLQNCKALQELNDQRKKIFESIPSEFQLDL